ncbi:MAG TPA: CAP domain-containing protein [Burkholderiales bacterium]|nr:CAP domain-containing protein [Burkholderiales bacterium]
MVRRRYFAHVSPGGGDVGDRVRRAGYVRGTGAWTVGEVLAWLVRPRPTPDATVRAWMRSPPHRTILLRAAFRDVGTSYALGNPRSRRGGATWAAVLGRRQ